MRDKKAIASISSETEETVSFTAGTISETDKNVNFIAGTSTETYECVSFMANINGKTDETGISDAFIIKTYPDGMWLVLFVQYKWLLT